MSHDLNPCRQYLKVTQSANDPMAGFYLAHGRSFEISNTKLAQRGVAKQCYRNAGTLVIDDCDGLYTYCEGYVHPPGLFPIHHAWCLDGGGKVIDPTLRENPDNLYFGIAITTEHLLATILKTGVWGVLGPTPCADVAQSLLDGRAPEWVIGKSDCKPIAKTRGIRP